MKITSFEKLQDGTDISILVSIEFINVIVIYSHLFGIADSTRIINLLYNSSVDHLPHSLAGEADVCHEEEMTLQKSF